jgi:methylglutaconyl-CoA hydratase
MTDSVLFSVDDKGIARLTLNRPDVHNAFDDDVIAHLLDAIADIDSSSRVRALVIASNGKHFSAGADLNWMKRMADLTYGENIADAGQLATLMSRLNQVPVPVLTVVQGAAYAGALGLLCCSDVTIASERATFCVSEVKLGLSPAVISPYVVAVIGQRAARRYFLSAEVFDAATALQLGLVQDVVPEDTLQSAADGIVNNWRKMGPGAMRETKHLIRRVSGSHPDDETIRFTQELIAGLRVSEEGQEGLTAFFEKRSPRWQK